ncbi:MAG: hypothetical protein P4N60_19235 [Verrucomicrobiae bacterium]|nr:hypothetical protein [Verrucomicrobiae bacterium]
MKTLLCLLAATAMLCGCHRAAPVRWEYKTETLAADASARNARLTGTNIDWSAVKYEDEQLGEFDFPKNWNLLDAQGKDHWELVSATPLIQTSYPDTAAQPYTRTEKIFLIFKRPY